MKWLAVAILSVSVCSGVNADKFRVTNYDGPTTKTASGHRAKYGVCAAEWRYHSPGTIIKLDTGERLVVADNGPAVKGRYHIDRYNPSHRVFPTVSRGYVVSRGGPCRNRKEIYQAVLKALEKKKKLDVEAQRNIQDLKDRFFSKVDKRGKDDCWNWKAGRGKDGYGRFTISGKKVLAHRVSFEIHKGRIPDGLCVLHTCVNNRACVNPNHLYLGTNQDNADDKVRQGRQSKVSSRGNTSLSQSDVDEIRRIARSKEMKQCEIADIYGISPSQVTRIVKRLNWR